MEDIELKVAEEVAGLGNVERTASEIKQVKRV
jgi:hypothetical protein